MYGQADERGIVHTRVLSFSLYVLALLLGIVTIPLVLLGPSLLGDILPEPWDALIVLYWPLVTLLTVGGLTNLYHVSTPRRSPWLRDVPGAVLTLVIWLLASFFVRGTIAASLSGGTSIYGPLSAPIVLLIWLYALAIAVLIGAAFNAAIRELWPAEEHRSLRRRLWTAWRERRRNRARRAGWGDPFDGYGPGDDTGDLGLSGLRDAARGPLTPISGHAPAAPGGGGRARRRARGGDRPRGRPTGRRAGRCRALMGDHHRRQRAAGSRFGFGRGHRIMSPSTPNMVRKGHGDARGCSSVGRAQPCQG